MSKKWIITAAPDRDGKGGGKALVYNADDLAARKAAAKKAGAHLDVKEA